MYTIYILYVYMVCGVFYVIGRKFLNLRIVPGELLLFGGNLKAYIYAGCPCQNVEY